MNTRTALALSACLSIVSMGVSAVEVEGEVEASGDGYVNVGGVVLKTGLNECMQTGSLREDNLINQCAGIEEEVEEVVAEVEEVMAPEPPAAPEQTAQIDTREFSEVTTFDVNSATLTPAGATVMRNLFDSLAEFKGITGISVTGHTDSTGSEEYNQVLSEQRAATVAAEIATQYPDANIEVTGMGESSPIASNDTAEGRQQNRRVDIEITATRMIFN